MANMQIGDIITFKSTSDYSAAGSTAFILHLVKLDAANPGQIVLASAAADKIIGVLQNQPKAGDTASIMSRNASGVGKCYAGGTIAIGDYLTSDANGAVVATTTAGQEVVGIATEAAVSGQVVGFLFANSRY